MKNAPHWVIAMLTLLITSAPQIGQQFPALAPFCNLFISIGTIVLGVLGATTASVLHGVNVKAAAVKVAGALLALPLLLLAFATTGCTNGQLNPQAVSVTTDGLQLLACGLGVYVKDSASTPINWAQMAIDMGTSCGMDVADIVAIFGSSSPLGQAASANGTAVHQAAAAYRALHAGH
jgi:hypothetical protein